MVLFNSLTCLVVFYCNSLRDFRVSSLRASTCLSVFCIYLRELIMSFSKSSIGIIICYFKSKPCFSSVLGYPRLAVVGELGLDDAMSPWFLLVTFLHLPFTMWLSLVLVGPDVSGRNLSLLWACKPVSAPLGDQLSPCPEVCGSAQPLTTDGAWKDPVLTTLPLLCSLHS